MKNIFALIALSSLIVLGGCKKGEEDPAIAFSSRDGRLSGDWSLTGGSFETISSIINQAPDSEAKSETVETKTYTISTNGASFVSSRTVNGDKPGADVTYDFKFGIDMSISKDGSYVNTFDGQIVGANGQPKAVVDKSSGLWSWINSGKNKVGVNFVSNANTVGIDLISGNFNLKKLSGSEMILVRNTLTSNQEITQSSIQTNEYAENVELVFTKN